MSVHVFLFVCLFLAQSSENPNLTGMICLYMHFWPKVVETPALLHHMFVIVVFLLLKVVDTSASLAQHVCTCFFFI